jgi:hypothetical protein
MANRSRKIRPELLEGRRLLSFPGVVHPGYVSILSKTMSKKESVVGTIPGSLFLAPGPSATFLNVIVGTGTLPVLGAVQMGTTLAADGPMVHHGAMTLTTSEGTLTFAAVQHQSRSR